MANESWTKVFICIILLWGAASSQSITRYSGDDKFPNPDTAMCGLDGCRQSNGYKGCVGCCTCICNYGSYLTSQRRCMGNDQLVQGHLNFIIIQFCKNFSLFFSYPLKLKITMQPECYSLNDVANNLF